MNVTVYLGSSSGNKPIYTTCVKELGKLLGTHGHTLVFGGSNAGTMGILADAVKENGGKVIGIIPTFLTYRKQENMDETYVVETMQERKAKMMELGEAFIAMPGSTGTLEEISEVMSAVKLNRIHKPYVFMNLNGYYEGLRECFKHMTEEGFMSEEEYELIHFANTLEEVKETLSL